MEEEKIALMYPVTTSFIVIYLIQPLSKEKFKLLIILQHLKDIVHFCISSNTSQQSNLYEE